MVHVTVNFECDQQRWAHGFDVEGGCTISELKRSMLSPPGSQEDIDSFELRLLGRRVPDFDKIEQPASFDFVYLGSEAGAERAREDQRGRADWERRRSHDASAEEARRRRAAADEEATRRREAEEREKAAQEAEAARAREVARMTSPAGEHEVPAAVAAAQVAPAAESFPSARPAPRPKDLPAPPKSSVGDAGWIVVGGVDKGGILVREGRATSSTQLPERLATGAVVEELGVEGERLNYRKLTGAGPETGWVSLSISGKTLMESRRLVAEDLFTLERALSLQEGLIRGFADHGFQRALAKLIAEHPGKAGAAFLSKRRELILSVQKEVLPGFGFEGSDRGVNQMMAAFGPRHQCEECGWNQGQIQMLLQM